MYSCIIIIFERRVVNSVTVIHVWYVMYLVLSFLYLNMSCCSIYH